MIRRPPRSTLERASAASDVYKRQGVRNSGEIGPGGHEVVGGCEEFGEGPEPAESRGEPGSDGDDSDVAEDLDGGAEVVEPVGQVLVTPVDDIDVAQHLSLIHI